MAEQLKAATMTSRRVVRNPAGRHRPLSEPTTSEVLYHGACLHTPGPYGDDGPKADAAAKSLMDSIDTGLDALENGTSAFALDVEAVPDAPVEVFDLFAIQTGEHVTVWRVACRKRRSAGTGPKAFRNDDSREPS